MKFYDRSGAEIDLRAWMFLQSNDEYRKIDCTRITSDVVVSTIWLGIDYGPGYPLLPLIFETMTFDRREGPAGTQVWRYMTEEAALLGHLAACEVAHDHATAENN